MEMILVSACLLAYPVRYSGEKTLCDHPQLRRWQAEGRLLAFCPEVAGGLLTPRPPAEIAEGKGGRLVLSGEARVIDLLGEDLTESFVQGARQAQAVVASRGIRMAILKEGSPSCGSGYCYDGTFSHVRLALPGVTAAALEEAGVRVFAEHQIDAAASYLAELERARSTARGK